MNRSPRAAFTLVEMMVTAMLIAFLAAIMITALTHVSAVWQRTAGKSEQFREARDAFEIMTTRLAQATLDTHWEYDNPAQPTRYRRDSNLRFISGPASELLGEPPADTLWSTHAVFFQAPFGVSDIPAYQGHENLLCTWGYHLAVADDLKLRPPFLTPKTVPVRVRPRLMELWHPSEKNSIFKFTGGPLGVTYSGREWFRAPLAGTTPPAHVLAENIVALIITPRLAPAEEEEVKGGSASADPDRSPLAPEYLYDSAPLSASYRGDGRHQDPRLNPVHQLPPMLQVSLVAVDEMTAASLGYTTKKLDPLSLDGRFEKSGDYGSDMLQIGAADSLENQLIARRGNYRIFTTNVVIRGAKWSREQKEVVTP